MIPPFDTRYVVFMVWGLGTVVVYTVVLRDRWRSWRHHRDARSRRDTVTAFGFFLTALAASGAIAFVLFGPTGSGIRGLFIATSLGAFFGTGVIMATSRSRDVE